MSNLSELSLDLTTLRRAIADGSVSPEAVVDEVLARIETTSHHYAWIHVALCAELLERVALARKLLVESKAVPLFGVPVAVKDNIDVAGIPTTVACREFAYTPQVSAPVVEKLVAAGAIIIGKTNLDQFATGLTGTRLPYGICRNAFDPRFISGGSSSGSAVAVALGMVSFALATDTAGSGRVPAAFNNIIGLKPSPGARELAVPGDYEDCLLPVVTSSSLEICVFRGTSGNRVTARPREILPSNRVARIKLTTYRPGAVALTEPFVPLRARNARLRGASLAGADPT